MATGRPPLALLLALEVGLGEGNNCINILDYEQETSKGHAIACLGPTIQKKTKKSTQDKNRATLIAAYLAIRIRIRMCQTTSKPLMNIGSLGVCFLSRYSSF